MFATERKSRKSRGTVLIAVMTLAVSVSALCLLTLTSSTSTYATARSRLQSTKAFYVGEGAVDYVMGNLQGNPWWAARDTTAFPTQNGDGSFESNWCSFGAKGGEFKIVVTYVKANAVPTTWTSNGFPTGYTPFSNVVFSARATSRPTFTRIRAKVIGRFNGTTRQITAGIEYRSNLYSSAIVSDAAPIAGTGTGKPFAIAKDAIVVDTPGDYIYGGIKANNGIYVGGSSTPLTDANTATTLGGFSGSIKANLEGTSEEIPDFTSPGAATQLFDFNRFKAAAAAGAGAVYPNLATFAAAMRAANTGGTHLQGVIYVTVDAAVEGATPHIMTGTTGTDVGPLGINIDGTLIFHFVNAADRFYKVFGWAPIHINAAPNDGTFNAADPTTFKTGYPPTLPSAKQACNVDITGSGFANFAAGDDMPALMFDNGTVDIHKEANICGAMYSPSFMEIENFDNVRQYFNGTLISGGGVFFDNKAGTGKQIVNFDASVVDNLPTFDFRGVTPTIVAYAVGQ